MRGEREPAARRWAAHVVISNGVFNLCPDKPRALAETARVLGTEGRLLMADILLEGHMTARKLGARS
jgi:ubiquinone/menaquinone biosynthesis C-methylase UbiE